MSSSSQDASELRVGIDLVLVETVRAALTAHGEGYLRRIYTDQEIGDCTHGTEIAPERLAARFAAKEATIKVLRPGADDPLPWRSIEVLRDHDGWVGMRLNGRAAALAAEAGITELAVSLTHEGPFASAVVVAQIHANPGESA